MRTSAARAAWFAGGVLACACCYLLVSATDFGSGPLFVLEEGISHTTGIPFGVVTVPTGAFLLIAALVLCAPVGPGTLAVPVLFGVLVSLLEPVVPTVKIASAKDPYVSAILSPCADRGGLECDRSQES
ncbi:MAG: hypothetical protein ACK5O2_05420 [Microthrixaceae bacterium]